ASGQTGASSSVQSVRRKSDSSSDVPGARRGQRRRNPYGEVYEGYLLIAADNGVVDLYSKAGFLSPDEEDHPLAPLTKMHVLGDLVYKNDALRYQNGSPHGPPSWTTLPHIGSRLQRFLPDIPPGKGSNHWLVRPGPLQL